MAKAPPITHCKTHFWVTSPTPAANFEGRSLTFEVRSLKFVGNSGTQEKEETRTEHVYSERPRQKPDGRDRQDQKHKTPLAPSGIHINATDIL
ncbi:hypothetical protein BaRGS_00029400 [Batillaria attramentaria]|uniref:Uncharacterized protein n=1 Tax=Batillaria attramentaria TaxID=370345 RepID=A0ABD0JWG6_9CAEN